LGFVETSRSQVKGPHPPIGSAREAPRRVRPREAPRNSHPRQERPLGACPKSRPAMISMTCTV
jgi:hypothetical protein